MFIANNHELLDGLQSAPIKLDLKQLLASLLPLKLICHALSAVVLGLMSNEIYEDLLKQRARLDDFFSRFSWAFLNFTARHHVQLDKYWHDFPSWRFSFKHPKGGVASLEVFREGGTQVSIYAYWWMDDYDQGTRWGRVYKSELLNIDSVDIADVLEETLVQVVSWPIESLTDRTTGLAESWRRHFTKEQFELEVDNNPHLKPHSIQDCDDV